MTEERDSQIIGIVGGFNEPLPPPPQTVEEAVDEIRARPGWEASHHLAIHEDPDPRTPAQRHTDTAFDHAQTDIGDARGLTASGLEWAESAVGPAIPDQFRRLPQLIGQFEIWLTEQRRLKG